MNSHIFFLSLSLCFSVFSDQKLKPKLIMSTFYNLTACSHLSVTQSIKNGNNYHQVKVNICIRIIR